MQTFVVVWLLGVAPLITEARSASNTALSSRTRVVVGDTDGAGPIDAGPVEASTDPDIITTSPTIVTLRPSTPASNGSTIHNGSAILSSLIDAIPSTLWTEAEPATTITVTKWPLQSNGTGFAYASSCNSELAEYSVLSFFGWSMVNTTVTTTVTNYSASITTLCDGYPRIIGTLTSTGTWTRSGLNYSTVAYPGPSPSCKINPDDCAAYRTSWSAAARAHAALDSATATTFVTIDRAATALTTGNDILGYNTIQLEASNGSFPTLTIGKATYAPSPPGSVQGCTQCSTESYWKVKAFQRQGYASYAAMPPGASWLVLAEKQAWSGSWQAPQCTVSATTANSDICGPCTINGGTVQLLYFPVPLNASRGVCATRLTDKGTVCPFGKTMPQTTTQFNISPDQEPCNYYPTNSTDLPESGASVVSGGHTFYANKAYISLQDPYAANACGQVGKRPGSTILTLQSSDIYSVYDPDSPEYAYTNRRTATSFNFADLNPEIPAIAYNGARGCELDMSLNPAISSAFGGGMFNATEAFINGQIIDACNIIYDPGYAPVLAVPPQIRDIDPEWASCALNLEGFYDPPHALEAATSEIGVVIPTTEASPASSATSPGAPMTTNAAATSTNTAQNSGSPSSNPQPASPPLQPGSSTPQPESTNDLQSAASGDSAVDDPAQATGSQDGQNPNSDEATTVTFTFAGSTDPAIGTDGSVLQNPISTGLQSAHPESGMPGALPVVTTIVIGVETYTISRASEGQVVVNDGTLPADNAETVIDGQTIQNAKSAGIIIESSTIIVAHGSGTEVESGNALVPTVVVGSQTIAIPEAGQTELLIGTSTIGLPATDAFVTAPGDGQDPAATTALIGSQVFTISRADSSEVVVNGVPLVAIGTHAIVDGQTVAAIGDSGVIIGASTIAIPAAARTSEDPSIAFMANGQAFTATKGSNGVVFIGSAVLSSGAETVIDGVTISAGGSDLVLDGTSTLSFSMQSQIAAPHAAATFEAGGEVFTASEVQVTSGNTELAAIAVGSTTIVPGQQLTLDGVAISAGSDGLVVGNTATVALASTAGSATSSWLAVITKASTSRKSPVRSSQGTSRSTSGGVKRVYLHAGQALWLSVTLSLILVML